MQRPATSIRPRHVHETNCLLCRGHWFKKYLQFSFPKKLDGCHKKIKAVFAPSKKKHNIFCNHFSCLEKCLYHNKPVSYQINCCDCISENMSSSPQCCQISSSKALNFSQNILHWAKNYLKITSLRKGKAAFVTTQWKCVYFKYFLLTTEATDQSTKPPLCTCFAARWQEAPLKSCIAWVCNRKLKTFWLVWVLIISLFGNNSSFIKEGRGKGRLLTSKTEVRLDE